MAEESLSRQLGMKLPNDWMSGKASGIASAIARMKNSGIPDAEIVERASCDPVVGKFMANSAKLGFMNPPSISVNKRSVTITVSKDAPRQEETVPKVKSRCHVTGKVIYSKSGARRALIGALGQDRSAPRRMYFCEHCKMYHLTKHLR